MASVYAPYGKGDKYKIEKGETVYSFYPGWPVYGKECPRARSVKVDHIIPGYTDVPGYVDMMPKIVWSGSGGYWFWVKYNPTNP